jgi:tetratricopeptide (TPR) repeat protein
MARFFVSRQRTIQNSENSSRWPLKVCAVSKLTLVSLLAILSGLAKAETAESLRPTVPSIEGQNTKPEILPDTKRALNSEASWKEKLRKAKQLIVDSFPDDRAAAENLLISAIRENPRAVESYADLARFQLWMISVGLREPAEIQLVTELATFVKDFAQERPLGTYLMSEIYLTLGQAAKANVLYMEGSKKFPKHVDTLVYDSRYWSQTDPSRALKAAQQALSLGHPIDDLSPAIALAIVTLQKSLSRSPAVGLEKFAHIYPDRWIWHRAALAYAEESRFEEAKKAYEKAIQLGNVLESKLQLGILHYKTLGKPKEAAKLFDEVYQTLQKKGAGTGSSAALAMGHKSLALLEVGDEAETRKTVKTAIRISRSQKDVLLPLIEEFVHRKNGQLVVEGMEELIKAEPDLEYGHILLGNLASDRKDYRGAQLHFSRAIALSPERDDLYSARAHAAYREQKFSAARRDFEYASRLRPEQASYHYNIACMDALMGRKQEAFESLREAININADLKILAASDQDLEALRKDKSLRQELVSLGIEAPETSGDAESEITPAESGGPLSYAPPKAELPD